MRLTEILMHIGTLIDYTSVRFFQIKGFEPTGYKNGAWYNFCTAGSNFFKSRLSEQFSGLNCL